MTAIEGWHDGRAMKVSIKVYGVAQPQGNKTVRNGNVVEGKTASAQSAFKSWRAAVTDKARDAAEVHGPFPDVPLHVSLIFWMPKPKGARKGAQWCATRPDIDKLERAVFDALTQSGLIHDDSRIVTVESSKPYVWEGQAPGVHIVVSTVEVGVD